MEKNSLYSRVNKKTKGLLKKLEIETIIKGLDEDYNVIFLRDLKKFKEKLTLQKDKENIFKPNRIIQKGNLIIHVDEKPIKFGIKEPYKEPKINVKDLMVVSIETMIFEKKNLKEVKKDLVIYLDENC